MAARIRSTAPRATLVLMVLLASAPLTALGHGGERELRVTPSTVAAGDEVTVSGEGFAPDDSLELHITGPNGDAHFGDVQPDAEGAFTARVRIPGDVVPGVYLLRGEGGNQEATATLTVGAMAGMTAAPPELTPARDRSTAWRTAALAVFLALGLGGVALARSVHLGGSARQST